MQQTHIKKKNYAEENNMDKIRGLGLSRYTKPHSAIIPLNKTRVHVPAKVGIPFKRIKTGLQMTNHNKLHPKIDKLQFWTNKYGAGAGPIG